MKADLPNDERFIRRWAPLAALWLVGFAWWHGAFAFLTLTNIGYAVVGALTVASAAVMVMALLFTLVKGPE